MRYKQWISRALLLSGLIGCQSVYADATSEGVDLLASMVKSSRELSFQGELVYQQGSHLEGISIIHRAEGGGLPEGERILYLDGLPREALRRGEEFYFSSRREGVTKFQRGSLIPMVSKFQGNIGNELYEAKIAGVDRVAGREAYVLLLLPKDRFRYGYQLWIDRASALLLKSLLVDEQGVIIERLQFTDLNVGPLSERQNNLLSRELPETAKTIDLQSGSDKTVAQFSWESGWLPDGFVLDNEAVRASPVSDHEVTSRVYSDGIASFSVFVEEDDSRVLSQASEKIGAMAAVSKVYRDNNQYYHVTVVGDIPLGTAERVAVSVRPVTDQP
ncbi:MucB/RseB C-terminal domain-containing protein [Endozoicomonas ascidiicola]|uniref:MucB/RseB C-terminal domain-containing protein n=1 Tax=Endozoicomonas ascidiicola TaxID=1698521 RepID=UPI00082F6E97|nr:MucB/RseB C-terminal domain-containing protein [Endozoicomonas ascidiicola]